MMLELSDKERDLLVQLLSTHAREMLIETRHTSTREFRERLKAEQATVESLLENLNAMKMAA
ncbi:MAG: hypothetical protein NT105_19255 [Verrucomicrobia bacterium]|nr:hypothetical protein [Verrucomicrobiota bacterium]